MHNSNIFPIEKYRILTETNTSRVVSAFVGQSFTENEIESIILWATNNNLLAHKSGNSVYVSQGKTGNINDVSYCEYKTKRAVAKETTKAAIERANIIIQDKYSKSPSFEFIELHFENMGDSNKSKLAMYLDSVSIGFGGQFNRSLVPNLDKMGIEVRNVELSDILKEIKLRYYSSDV